jgi:hypothetical protein
VSGTERLASVLASESAVPDDVFFGLPQIAALTPWATDESIFAVGETPAGTRWRVGAVRRDKEVVVGYAMRDPGGTRGGGGAGTYELPLGYGLGENGKRAGEVSTRVIFGVVTDRAETVRVAFVDGSTQVVPAVRHAAGDEQQRFFGAALREGVISRVEALAANGGVVASKGRLPGDA